MKQVRTEKEMTGEAGWLLDWFKQRAPVTDNTPGDDLQLNYFEAGLIDSLGVIEMIAEVENHFGIRFNEKHFQDRRFSTIHGLSELIAEVSGSGNETGCIDEG